MNARGSAYELQTQIDLAIRLEYFGKDPGRDLTSRAEEVSRMINGMLRALGKDPDTRALKSQV